jgi:hypothetical protein
MIRAGHEHRNGEGLGRGKYALIIGCEDNVVQMRTLAGAGIDMPDHGFSQDHGQRFSLKTRRGVAGGDDAVAWREWIHGIFIEKVFRASARINHPVLLVFSAVFFVTEKVT